MAGVSGDFEIHLTVERATDALIDFAAERGVKFSHIVLDRGTVCSQPMLTLTGHGTLAEQRELAAEWRDTIEGLSCYLIRTKIEAAPWNQDVPETDEVARDEDADRYFEHHIKLVLPDASVARLIALTRLVVPHGARLSRNARRTRDDGFEERFVTQRCHRVGRVNAHERLLALLADLNEHRRLFVDIAEVVEEYVVYDTGQHIDHGWFTPGHVGHDTSWEDGSRQAPAGVAGYPSTYRPLPDEAGLRQRAAFDPALKHFPQAYRAGEPQFVDPHTHQAWRAARETAMAHLLSLIIQSPWAPHLVLRGSVPLRAWLGEAAREPGDLDFVVTPSTMAANRGKARQLLAGIITAVREQPLAGLSADGVADEDIWTYERAPGRRLVFPFAVPGLPGGTVQVDVVFNEKLPIEPITVRIPPLNTPVRAASPELSLLWKLLWLETDMWPQGKDLYDATLLAEHTTVSLDLVRDTLRPELGAEADSFTAASVLRWKMDWTNFRDEYPTVNGDATHWLERLALALGRSFGEPPIL